MDAKGRRVGFNLTDNQVKDQAQQALYVWYQKMAEPHLPKDGEDFRRRALDDILSVAEEAIRARGHFDFVLAGGGTPRTIYESLRRLSADWKKWDWTIPQNLLRQSLPIS